MPNRALRLTGPVALWASGLLVAAPLVALPGCGSSADGSADRESGPPANGSDPPPKLNIDGGTESSPSCSDDSLDLEGCSCAVGTPPRNCYPGPTTQAGVGACHEGNQTCVGSGGGELKTGVWGPCEGSGQPLTCATSGASCGKTSDGCGGELDCGVCADCTDGTVTFSTPGNHDFTLPDFATLTVQVWGAGGGGRAYAQIEDPTDGGASSFAGSVIAGGGESGNTGKGGLASGGSTNLPGGDAAPACDQGYPVICAMGPSGSSPNGGPGVGSIAMDGCSGGDGKSGEPHGGGGGTTWTCQGAWWQSVAWGYSGIGGGGGAYSSISYTKGQLSGSVQVVVGAGGLGSRGATTSGFPATGRNPGYYTGGDGANGAVTLTWTCQ